MRWETEIWVNGKVLVWSNEDASVNAIIFFDRYFNKLKTSIFGQPYFINSGEFGNSFLLPGTWVLT